MHCQFHSSDLTRGARLPHSCPLVFFLPLMSVKCLYTRSKSEAPPPQARDWIRAHLLWVLLQWSLQLCNE